MSGTAAGLSDGAYSLAIRPYHVLPSASKKATVRLDGRVQVTELSGSESSAHFDLGLGGTAGGEAHANWVSLSAGVHPYEIGEMHDFYMDPSACYFFAPDGSRAA